MRIVIAISFFFCLGTAQAQRVVVISSLPANTPSADVIYLAGSANGWNPGDPTWTFVNEDGLRYLDVPESAPNTFQGKITRGSWATVEGNASGGFLPDRTFAFNGSNDTLNITVQSWEGSAPPPSDLPPNVVVLDNAFFMPELDRSRRVRLFLPSDYDSSEAHYPVLYMHDGQNLFSAQESFAGEWEVDESMLAFEADGYSGAIIVAIDNGGTHRVNEYTPHAHPQHGGGEGDQYSSFIVNTLKAYVDAEYRTLSGREHNGLMGSSLGGLISFYAAMKYQDVFSRVGVFSPSFWFNDSIYTFAEAQGKQHDMKFFFLAGGQESANLQSQVEAMVTLLEDAGFEEDEIRYDFVPNGQHSEWFWRQNFPPAFEWLYMNESLSLPDPVKKNEVRIFPNPTAAAFDVTLSQGMIASGITLFDQMGKIVKQYDMSSGRYELGDLARGVYFVHISSTEGTYVQKLMKQ